MALEENFSATYATSYFRNILWTSGKEGATFKQTYAT